MKIKSFESIRNYEEKYLERQTLGRRVVCLICPADQGITLQTVGFLDHSARHQTSTTSDADSGTTIGLFVTKIVALIWSIVASPGCISVFPF